MVRMGGWDFGRYMVKRCINYRIGAPCLYFPSKFAHVAPWYFRRFCVFIGFLYLRLLMRVFGYFHLYALYFGDINVLTNGIIFVYYRCLRAIRMIRAKKNYHFAIARPSVRQKRGASPCLNKVTICYFWKSVATQFPIDTSWLWNLLIWFVKLQLSHWEVRPSVRGRVFLI